MQRVHPAAVAALARTPREGLSRFLSRESVRFGVIIILYIYIYKKLYDINITYLHYTLYNNIIYDICGIHDFGLVRVESVGDEMLLRLRFYPQPHLVDWRKIISN